MEYVKPPPPTKDPLRPVAPWLVVVTAGGPHGLDRLAAFVAALPETLPAAVMAILRGPRPRREQAPRALARAARLSVVTPYDGEALHPGVCYVADADHALAVGLCGEARLVSHHAAEGLVAAVSRAGAARTVAVLLDVASKSDLEALGALRKAGGAVVLNDGAAGRGDLSDPAQLARLATAAVGRGD